MSTLNWQKHFKDLPEIPIHKLWFGDNQLTFEQQITMKVVKGEKISNDEEIVLVGLHDFYDHLYNKLLDLNYSTLTKEDIENFKLYIFYAFNFGGNLSNQYTVLQTFRMVVNEYVIGEDKAITRKQFLQYAPLEIVKSKGLYNRANTSNTTVFYSGTNIDTCLKELKPPINKRCTVGIWRPNKQKTFTTYPIPYGEALANEINEDSKAATMAAIHCGGQDNRSQLRLLQYYLKILGREYTKVVSHKLEYLLSALWSEKILEQSQFENDVSYDCIIYPSVGNGYKTSNFAIRPQVIDNDFYLVKVIEFEIEDAFYDTPYVLTHPEKISLAKIKNGRVARNVNNSTGDIDW